MASIAEPMINLNSDGRTGKAFMTDKVVRGNVKIMAIALINILNNPTANVTLTLDNVFDPFQAATQFFTLAVGLFNIFINAIAIIFTLPLTTLSVINAFPVLPSEFKLIIGSFAIIIETFGAIFFLITAIGALRGVIR